MMDIFFLVIILLVYIFFVFFVGIKVREGLDGEEIEKKMKTSTNTSLESRVSNLETSLPLVSSLANKAEKDATNALSQISDINSKIQEFEKYMKEKSS